MFYFLFFFFFKQKTAYEISACLVGSEMCIRDRDMTQAQMAKLLNCSQRIYSNYERGDVNIPIPILIQLALIHNTSIDYLLDLTDDPIPPERKIR